ncbi:MAG: hypothetical protein QW051_05060, partial [Candidatus Aenigmatarchaeota archaeon]
MLWLLLSLGSSIDFSYRNKTIFSYSLANLLIKILIMQEKKKKLYLWCCKMSTLLCQILSMKCTSDTPFAQRLLPRIHRNLKVAATKENSNTMVAAGFSLRNHTFVVEAQHNPAVRKHTLVAAPQHNP